MAAFRDPATCPACKAHGDFRVIDSTMIILAKEDLQHKIDRGLGKAREERQEHEKKFGPYERLAGAVPLEERRVISGMDPEQDITYVGNIGDKKKNYDDAAEA
jgi:hypothetical protein